MNPTDESERDARRIKDQQLVLLIVTGVTVSLYVLTVVVLKVQGS